MTTTRWKPGDRVRHAGRPEWGTGSVQSAEPATHQGQPCQRVVVRFEREGLKTLSTAFADLRSADQFVTLKEPRPTLDEAGPPTASDSPGPGTDPMIHESEAADAAALLMAVPESATDPFASPRRRLAATLDLYRFTGQGASLLDWAAMQTGLKDPMTRFNRHELENLFGRFQMNLDSHLRKLVKDLRRQDPAALAELSAAADPAAKQALRRADSGR